MRAVICKRWSSCRREFPADLSLLNSLESTERPNGIIMNVLDVENFAHKFTFPPPGKTSGEVHDRLCKKFAGKPVVTIGYGPDFAVLR
jgi:archaea-specific RecJ-like exonuclease